MGRLRTLSFCIFLISVIIFIAFSGVRYLHADHKGPVIRIPSDELTISVEDGEEKLLKGVTAKDDHDGDVTDSIMVENISNFTKDGKRVVTYAAVDSSNNVSRTTRVVAYSDYSKPRFEIKEAPRFSMAEVDSDSDYTKFVKASDSVDGDLTGMVKISEVGSSTETESGVSRVVEFQVSNSAGDVSTLPVTISYVEGGAPFINLSSYVVYVKKGGSIDPGKYISSVEVGNNKYSVPEYQTEHAGTVDIKNYVNTKESGVYTVQFTAISEGGKSSTTYMEVVVE